MKGNSLEDTPHENPSERSVRQHKITARAIDRKSDQRAKKEQAKLALKPICEHDKTHLNGAMVVQSYLKIRDYTKISKH